MAAKEDRLTELAAMLFQAHPWHGVSAGDEAPTIVTAFIEIVPTDTVKYELDKRSGHLRLDRPQRYSSLPPTPYGFIPQTYCGDEIAAFCQQRAGGDTRVERGDGDPIDICVLTEKDFAHGNFLIRAKPIGGLRMIDGGEADDKIVAVLEGDVAYGHLEDIASVPSGVIDRLRHYFLSYKQLPNDSSRRVEIASVYGREDAHEAIRRSQKDYRVKFGEPGDRLRELAGLVRSGSPR
jgi:inorganic pyrophosphatase